ncbi:MAG TPA: DinB family protein [Terriglobales bacterium]|nr:DinB family protein [Terriglobales bacterium]
MDIHDHRRSFAYDAWANHEVMQTLKQAGVPAGRSVHFLAHIIGAQHIWMERLLLQKQMSAVWPDLTLEQCEQELNRLQQAWNGYLEGLSPEKLNDTVNYRNSKGQQWGSRIGDILTHVVMHSAYHRGQIATEMRAHGYTPAYTDFIHGVRTGGFE